RGGGRGGHARLQPPRPGLRREVRPLRPAGTQPVKENTLERTRFRPRRAGPGRTVGDGRTRRRGPARDRRVRHRLHLLDQLVLVLLLLRRGEVGGTSMSNLAFQVDDLDLNELSVTAMRDGVAVPDTGA